jgi:hypothetical protein
MTKSVDTLIRKTLVSMRETGKTLLAVFQEIFDESAYARFLARQQRESSPEAYASFWKEQEGARARRPKCC